MHEQRQKVNERLRGCSLVDLLDLVGIDAHERDAIRARLLDELERMRRFEIAEKMAEGDVLNDDQVVIVVGTLLRELVAAIGHLRPVAVKLNQYTEIVELEAPATMPPSASSAPSAPRILLSETSGVGA